MAFSDEEARLAAIEEFALRAQSYREDSNTVLYAYVLSAREANRERMAQSVRLRSAVGLCIDCCDRTRAEPGRRRCARHLERCREAAKARREEERAIAAAKEEIARSAAGRRSSRARRVKDATKGETDGQRSGS